MRQRRGIGSGRRRSDRSSDAADDLGHQALVGHESADARDEVRGEKVDEWCCLRHV